MRNVITTNLEREHPPDREVDVRVDAADRLGVVPHQKEPVVAHPPAGEMMDIDGTHFVHRTPTGNMTGGGVGHVSACRGGSRDMR